MAHWLQHQRCAPAPDQIFYAISTNKNRISSPPQTLIPKLPLLPGNHFDGGRHVKLVAPRAGLFDNFDTVRLWRKPAVIGLSAWIPRKPLKGVQARSVYCTGGSPASDCLGLLCFNLFTFLIAFFLRWCSIITRIGPVIVPTCIFIPA